MDQKKQDQRQEADRILMRTLARELTVEELGMATGGTTSCSGCRADDCDPSTPILD